MAMLRCSLPIGLSAAMAVTALPLLASAADICISPLTVEALSDCPDGEARPVSGRRPPMKFTSTARPVDLRSPAQPPQPSAAATAAEIRRNLSSIQSTRLLVTQIQGLETLLAATNKTAPDRPMLIRRLADSYVELESSSFRAKIEARERALQVQKSDPAKAKQLTAEADRAEQVEISSRKAAIKQYAAHKAEYPRFCQTQHPTDPTRSTGCVDEVLYNLAYAYEADKNLEKARKTYLELIQSAPSSKYVPNAYLAFGELFFNEAQGNPTRWALAERAYKEVIRYPAPANAVLGYAHYKLAYVHWNKGELTQALSEFKKTIDHGAQFPKAPNARPLAASARHDLIPVYALVGDPRKAHDFLRPLSLDAVNPAADTYRRMGELGQAYLDTGHFNEAILLYQDLMRRDPGPRACAYQAHVTEAVLAMRAGDKAAIKAELDRQFDVARKLGAEAAPEDLKLACANTTASLVLETAMTFHLEAVGSGDVRGTADKKTMDLAADLYDRALRSFSRDQFERFQFPRIVKEDWPTILKIQYAMADLHYAQKAWAKCGPAFDAVVREQPGGPLAAEAAYASAICYQNLYSTAHEGRSDRLGLGHGPQNAASALDARELEGREEAMVDSFSRYLCAIKPAASDKEGQVRRVEVKYARARTYFEAHRWEEAAIAFRDIAFHDAAREVGIYAAQLYLEALNVMGSHRSTPRLACYDDLARDIPKLLELYCEGDKGKNNADQCGTLSSIQWDVMRMEAQRLVTSAKGDDPASLAAREKGAKAYLELWQKIGEKACEARQPACGRMDEVLHNAAWAFQAAHLLGKAIAVRKILIDPRYHLDRTSLGREALLLIGQNYQAMAVYDEAASYYERFARESAR
jgi:TolA-binding protein